MKEIRRERVKTEYYNVYVANDGSEFTTREECEKYEDSAECVIMAKVKAMLVKEISEEDVLGFGSSDCTVWLIKPKTQDDADVILQAFFYVNPHMKEDGCKQWVERAKNLISRAISEDDTLFIGRGYEMDSFWFIGTSTSMFEQFQKLSNPEKKD